MKVLKFEASWCGPCKALTKVINEAQSKITTEIEVCDIDAMPELATQYGVRGVPTMIMLDDEGKEVKRKVGAMREQELLAFLQ